MYKRNTKINREDIEEPRYLSQKIIKHFEDLAYSDNDINESDVKIWTHLNNAERELGKKLNS